MEQETKEMQTCPRNYKKMEDHWETRGDEKYCSYCGSLHPDNVLSRIEKFGFGVIETTDKDYKFYINGTTKFYTYHFSKEQIDKYNALVEKYKEIKQ